jgi:UDP-N-acetylglucosamine--N-acetylmuramyl-(pentapeptide) pyrophosphoryl-undecaprenol N-acetylglucosamine transferase
VRDDVFEIVFAGGGTGGHLFPALAVAEELRRRRPAASINFIGSKRGLEQVLVPRAGYKLRSLGLWGLKGKGHLARIKAAIAAGIAVLRCAGWFLISRPRLVIGVGGYASGPAVLAAWLLKIKTMVLEQNHFPGATNRFLAPRADAVCVPSADARERLGCPAHITGNPVRAEFREIGDPPGGTRLSILIFGGSQGSRSINQALPRILQNLSSETTTPQVVHQTGATDESSVRAAYSGYPVELIDVQPFIEDMPAHLAAADLAICRAGATTVAELAAGSRGAILIPLPHAADDHQRHNAETLSSVGAARIVSDRELESGMLGGMIEELAGDPDITRQMGKAAGSLDLPHATQRIAEIALRLISGDAMRNDDALS